MDAVLELKHYSTERLLDLWEMTTTNSDHNIPAMKSKDAFQKHSRSGWMAMQRTALLENSLKTRRFEP